MGLIEVAIILGSVIGALSSGLVACVIHKRNKELLEQQKKADSVRLVLVLLEKWKGQTSFTEIVYDLATPNKQFTDKDKVNPVLAVFEDIAMLRHDKALTENHVREFFGRDIVRLDANKSIMKIVNDFYNKDHKHNYNNLKKMLDDSKEWGMEPY